MDESRIAGIGSTTYGKHEDASTRELLVEAASDAFDDADVSTDMIDAVYIGNFMGDITDDQGHMGALAADYLGMPRAASMRIESACASSGAAVYIARQAIAHGHSEAVLVAGVENMFATGIAKITDALANAADNEYENAVGLTFPAIYAMMMREYLRQTEATIDDLAAITVKNRANGVANPLSQFQTPIELDEVAEARPIAEPVNLLHACPITDGASAAVIVSDTFAKEHDLDASVSISGGGFASDTLALQDRQELHRTRAAEQAAAEAYAESGRSLDEIDVVEVHDCFTVAEALALESLGFYDRGEGWRGAAEGKTHLDGSLPVNTSGGLISKGHPVGATGVGQLTEITKQLEGRHPNQVDGATVGVTHNVGGSGASAVVHVLEVVA